jgi:hypothetical protein
MFARMLAGCLSVARGTDASVNTEPAMRPRRRLPIASGWLQSLVIAIAALMAAPQTHAAIGSIDNVPAATLLFPYFEVDLSNANGRSTVVSVTNSSATAILVNTTLWTNAGVPVQNFNIYLTGYDTQSVDLRTVLTGTLPRTGSAGQDPTDTISPHGPISQDINFASCNVNTQLPPANLSAGAVAELQALLTGRSSTITAGQCAGVSLGDNVARGYITMDSVNQCSASRPTDSGYFVNGGGGIATAQNVLLGDYMLIDRSQNLMTLENAVAIEAASPHPQTSVPGQYTFYGRTVAWTAADNREPLATSWSVQGDNNTSSAIIWRDPKIQLTTFACAGLPSYAPMGQEGMAFFDMSGDYTDPTTLSFAPVATQISPMNAATMGFPATTKMAWAFMNLNSTVAAAGSNPPEDPAAAQSHVTVLRAHKNTARLNSGAVATPLDSAVSASHFTPGN